MNAGRQRWWLSPTPGYLATVFAAYARHAELRREGFVPFTDRVHTRAACTAANVPILLVEDPPREPEGIMVLRPWVPAWSEELMESTFEFGDAWWRTELIERAVESSEYRDACLSVLRGGGRHALLGFVLAVRRAA